ncbi:hypothetical protein ORJ66_19965 [Pseudoalteromonas tunicata]|uniref:hypothetical protein n=1 Tax=Pseudoalteromonas tunicata TaxID=314281 RepID=UPI00273E0E5E|nr:hypothetical protein [Pseudoalteromonas tunicata]MDP5215331.1 hypothetical protein [Pseudoalteromonas tunicata]
MFTPYFLTEQDLGLYPEVDVRTDSCGVVLKLVFNSQVIEVFFREVIAFYCIEESNYELSPLPGMPSEVDFASLEKGEKQSPIWKSPANYRRSFYAHLDSYREKASLESYLIFGADYVVLVESIGFVDVKVAT